MVETSSYNGNEVVENDNYQNGYLLNIPLPSQPMVHTISNNAFDIVMYI